ncbi:MAG: hypothetical protein ACR2P2_21480 [Nakamurella sp.]
MEHDSGSNQRSPAGRSRARPAELDLAGLDSSVEALAQFIARFEELVHRLERATGARLLPDDVESRREALRPANIRILIVTMPMSAEDDTNFFLANSNLFRCVREAFVRAIGPGLPYGDDFLWFLHGLGVWVYHLPIESASTRGRPSDAHTRKTIALMRQVFKETKPEHIVGVKARIAARLRSAAAQVGMSDRTIAVSTPGNLCDTDFVGSLSKMIDPWDSRSGTAANVETLSPLATKVHNVLLDKSNRRLRIGEIATALSKDKRDGRRFEVRSVDVSHAIRDHRDHFDTNGRGVRLRDISDARGRKAAL